MKIYNEKFIATTEFGKYLSLNGWFLSSKVNGIFCVWESDIYPEYEIVQPLNPNASDFNRRIVELIDVLSKTQDKNFERIKSDLNEISEDVIRVRVIHDDVEQGTIPFNDGVELFVKTKDLLSSAARSLVKTQKGNYGGQSPKIVKEYFDSLKLSQTEIGSYVLKVESPINFTLDTQDDHCIEPFGRSVSNRVIHSILKLDEAIGHFKKSNNYMYFEEVVSCGVSASLCSAIIGLSGTRRNRSIEITIQPSPFAEVENLKTRCVRISSDDIPYIEYARGYYLDQYSIPNYSLSGKVIKLAREDDYGDGVATISEQINPNNIKKRNVECVLSENLYNQAIEAHGNSSTLDLTGNLVVSGRKVFLTDINMLRIRTKLL